MLISLSADWSSFSLWGPFFAAETHVQLLRNTALAQSPLWGAMPPRCGGTTRAANGTSQMQGRVADPWPQKNQDTSEPAGGIY